MRRLYLFLSLLLLQLRSTTFIAAAQSQSQDGFFPFYTVALTVKEEDPAVKDRVKFKQQEKKETYYVSCSIKPKMLVEYYGQGEAHGDNSKVKRLTSIGFIKKNGEVENVSPQELAEDADFGALYERYTRTKNLAEAIESMDALENNKKIYACYALKEDEEGNNSIEKHNPSKLPYVDDKGKMSEGNVTYSSLQASMVTKNTFTKDIDFGNVENRGMNYNPISTVEDNKSREDEFKTFLIKHYKGMLLLMGAIGTILFVAIYRFPRPESEEEEIDKPEEKEEQRVRRVPRRKKRKRKKEQKI